MLTIELGHIDWSRPVIWMNSLMTEGDSGMRYWPCRVISLNMHGDDDSKRVCLLYENNGKDWITYVSDFGYFKKEANSLAQRVVWNYSGTLPDINDVKMLGEM